MARLNTPIYFKTQNEHVVAKASPSSCFSVGDNLVYSSVCQIAVHRCNAHIINVITPAEAWLEWLVGHYKAVKV